MKVILEKVNKEKVVVLRDEEKIGLCKINDILNPVQEHFLNKGRKDFDINFKNILRN